MKHNATFKHNGNKIELHRYDGIESVMNSPIEHEGNANRWASEYVGRKRGRDWYGINLPADELLSLFTDGWTDGVERLNKRASEFAIEAPMSETTVTRPRMRYGEEGDSLDMQAVWMGDLEHAWLGMERRRMDDLKTRVHVFVDIGGHSGVKARELQWPGILAAAVTAKAMENNYDVKITGVNYNTDQYASSRQATFQAITLKHYDAPMSLANVAPMMLPAFFRAVGFRAFFGSAGKRELSYGLGRTHDISDDMARAAMGAELDDGTLIKIPKIRSKSAAIDCYKSIVKQLKEIS
jgi:hypothetical protein